MPARPSDTNDPPMIFEGELPPQILFNNQTSGSNAGGASSGGYECLVVYLADGTARDDVQIMFGKEGTRPIGLQLRALTGAVSLIDQPEDTQQ